MGRIGVQPSLQRCRVGIYPCPRVDVGVVLPDGLQQLQGVLLDTLLHGILLPSEPPTSPGALLTPLVRTSSHQGRTPALPQEVWSIAQPRASYSRELQPHEILGSLGRSKSPQLVSNSRNICSIRGEAEG